VSLTSSFFYSTARGAVPVSLVERGGNLEDANWLPEGFGTKGIKNKSIYYAAGSNLSLGKLKGATKKVHSSGLNIKYCGKDLENQ
jgi:hypothetical protein